MHLWLKTIHRPLQPEGKRNLNDHFLHLVVSSNTWTVFSETSNATQGALPNKCPFLKWSQTHQLFVVTDSIRIQIDNTNSSNASRISSVHESEKPFAKRQTHVNDSRTHTDAKSFNTFQIFIVCRIYLLCQPYSLSALQLDRWKLLRCCITRKFVMFPRYTSKFEPRCICD